MLDENSRLERRTSNAERALKAYAAMQRHLYLDGARLYRETVPVAAGANPFAYVWPFEEAAKATQCLLALPHAEQAGQRLGADVEDRQAGRRAYWQPRRADGLTRRPSYASYPPHPLGQGGDTYFDDNAWIALDLIQLYRMGLDGSFGPGSHRYRAHQHVALLDRAALLFELIAAGWCSGTGAADARRYPGGVYWVDAGWNRDRGCAVTAGLTVLALHLHELTAPETTGYLDLALRAYTWLRDTLLIVDGPMAGLYHDKVLGDGAIDQSQWIYNQGVVIAAGVMLDRVSGNLPLARTRERGSGGEGPDYLAHARATANVALTWYGAQAYAGQPAIFTAIFLRNLLQLAARLQSDDTATAVAYHAAMQAFGDRVWDDPAIHDPATDLFRFDGPDRACTLLDQAAMVQIYALLGWPPERYGLLA